MYLLVPLTGFLELNSTFLKICYRFTEIFVKELEDVGDLKTLVVEYLQGLSPNAAIVDGIVRLVSLFVCLGSLISGTWPKFLWAHNSPFPHDKMTTTPGTMSPTLCEKCVGFLTSNRTEMCMGFEKGTMVYGPYNTRGLESLTVCRWLQKGRTFSSVILRPLLLVRLGV